MTTIGELLNTSRYLISNKFLNQVEVKYLIDKANSSELAQSTIYEDNEHKPDATFRNSKSRPFQKGEDSVIDSIVDRVMRIIHNESDIQNIGVVADLIKYADMGFLKDHYDPFVDGRKPNREFTAICYLNETNGGQTTYPNLNLSVQPMAGKMFLFKNMINGAVDDLAIHRSEYVHGEKYILVLFINELL